MIDIAEVRKFEERAFNAWPALRTVVIDGWVARLSNGYTKRANSVNALGPAASADGIVAAAEALYARHELPAIFRLSPLAPAPIDAMLDTAGYAMFDPSLVLTAPIGSAGTVPTVQIDTSPSPAWLDGFARANAVESERRATHDAIIAAIAPPAAFATIHEDGQEDGEGIGFGLAVLERGAVGLFDIIVAPRRRGHGHGRALVTALLGWGRLAGADRAYLQVREANAVARQLYASLGFAEAYRYHYRVPRPAAQ